MKDVNVGSLAKAALSLAITLGTVYVVVRVASAAWNTKKTGFN